MKKIIKFSIVGMALAAPILATGAMAQSLPPADAKPGECYAKVLVPATYKNYSEQVQVHAGGINYTKTPAVYKNTTKQIMIAEESFELVAVPPTYKTVQETVLVQPEQVVKTVVPATYKTESKRIMISPSRVMWKAGRGAYEKIDSATGEIMCRVEVPAVYKDITQQIVSTPAQTQEKTVPAKYITITRRIVDTPPSTTRKVIPAQYKTVTIKELVTPESFAAVKTEPRFAAIQKRELQTPEAVKWRQILCETNVTQNVVINIQKALVRSGYSIGTQPNGNYGPATKAAIRKYQLAKGLPTGGLTLSTVKSLGL